ncbi:MAG TPA: hypothetical protein VHY81_05965 [Acidimicrobiales bacterium]|nr:hypothetical protein [Acidimicrobiales bacterium]
MVGPVFRLVGHRRHRREVTGGAGNHPEATVRPSYLAAPRELGADRLAGRHIEDAVDLGEGGRMGGAGAGPGPGRGVGLGPQPGAQGASCDRTRRAGDGAGVRRVGEGAGGERVEKCHLVAQHTGLPGEKGNRVAPGHLGAQRQQLVPDAVSDEGGVGVGRVVYEVESRGTAEAMRLAAAEAENGVPESGRHAGEPVRAGAAQQVDQDGLRLVVHGVAGRDVVGEDAEPGGAGAGLEVGTGLHGHGLRLEMRADLGCCGGDDVGFVGRPGTQAVVDMDGGHVASGGGGEDEKRDRVGPAGDRAGECCPRGWKGAAGQEVGDERFDRNAYVCVAGAFC